MQLEMIPREPYTIEFVADLNPHAVQMLDLRRQFAPLREELMAAIASVCDAQQFVLGPEVERFECAAAAACGAPFGIGCASGTDALWLALAGAGIGAGDTVITTPFSFFATVSSILRSGAQPLLADIDPLTFNLSPERVEDLLKASGGRRLRAVMPVHLYGQCADFDGFDDLKKRYGLVLIEDAAQAFGGTWRGIPAGALGDAAAFSFYPTKNLSAFGDGGLVTTTSAEIGERVRMLRAHGMRKRYFHEEIGGNSRLDTLQAAVLEVKLRYLPEWNQSRREIADRYDRLFHEAGLVGAVDTSALVPGSGKIVLPFRDKRADHVFHQYVIRADRRDALREHLSAHQIGSEVYYPLPLHLQESLSRLGYKRGEFPASEQAAAEVLALPIFPELRPDEQESVVGAIASFYR